jgi:hypothetical protein
MRRGGRRKKTVDTAVRFLAELERRQFSGVVELIFEGGGIRQASKVKVMREPVGDLLADSSSSETKPKSGT